jgi:hypothetical protein
LKLKAFRPVSAEQFSITLLLSSTKHFSWCSLTRYDQLKPFHFSRLIGRKRESITIFVPFVRLAGYTLGGDRSSGSTMAPKVIALVSEEGFDRV